MPPGKKETKDIIDVITSGNDGISKNIKQMTKDMVMSITELADRIIQSNQSNHSNKNDNHEYDNHENYNQQVKNQAMDYSNMHYDDEPVYETQNDRDHRYQLQMDQNTVDQLKIFNDKLDQQNKDIDELFKTDLHNIIKL